MSLSSLRELFINFVATQLACYPGLRPFATSLGVLGGFRLGFGWPAGAGPFLSRPFGPRSRPRPLAAGLCWVSFSLALPPVGGGLGPPTCRYTLVACSLSQALFTPWAFVHVYAVLRHALPRIASLVCSLEVYHFKGGPTSKHTQYRSLLWALVLTALLSVLAVVIFGDLEA